MPMSRNLRLYSAFARAFRCCALSFCLISVVAAQSRDRRPATAAIVGPIDPAVRVTLAGNTRPEANTQNDLGKVADSFAMDHMLLLLERSPEREQALRNFIDQQYDPKSPNFHQWLSAFEFGRTYGPAPQDIDTVSAWLRENGFAVNTVYPSGMAIDFSGTAGQVATAFGTEIHKLSVDGAERIANMSDPSIPAALAPAIAGIVSLNNFVPHSMKLGPGPKYSVDQQFLVPADLAVIYDLKAAFAAGITGEGQTITVLEDSDPFNTADWGKFRNTFGLDTYTSGSLSVINPAPPSGSSNCSDPGAVGADIETTLDAEWASAAAPNAAIQIAACADTTATPGFVIAAQNVINGKHPPQVISLSYGFCEVITGAAGNAAYNSAYQQAVAEGVSVFVAAGDAGAAACDHNYSTATHGIGVSSSSSTPYNVAVGGTDFGDTYQGTNSTYWGTMNGTDYGSALSYIPEIPWNGSCASAIIAGYFGYATGYGPAGFCGSALAEEYDAFTTGAGSGGPSGCATGVPAQNLVVGGTCKGYPKPSWQTGVAGIPNDGVRDVPDVALFASNGIWGHAYVFCFSDLSNGGASCAGPPSTWALAGGTSFASPIMAGIQALVNQKMGASQGNPNPVYYKLAASSVASSVFHSITTGDIAVNCSGDISCYGSGFEERGRSSPFAGNGGLSTSTQTYTPAFASGAGWNFATGLGSVDAFNLISNWSKGQ
jgi:subtilase family serine protease